MTRPRPRLVFFATQLYALATGQTSGYGGAEAELWTVANQLAETAEFDVQVLTIAPDLAAAGPSEHGGAAGLTLAPPSRPITYENSWLERRLAILRYFTGLFRSARRLKGDVYFTKLASAEAAVMWFVARFNRAKFIYRVEHDWETNPGDLTRIIFRGSGLLAQVFLFCLRRADLVVVQTEKQQAALRDNYGISSVRIQNAHRIPPEQAIERDPQKRPHVLWVGRCHPMKRPELLLELARKNPGLSFQMILSPNAGQENLFDSCAEQAREISNLELIEGVSMADMDSYYQRARVLVLTSDAEGFSNVVIEALKNGAAALTWDHNPDNILADVADPAAIRPAPGYCVNNRMDLATDVLNRLYADAGFWSACQAEARRVAEERFGVESIVEIYADHIRRLLGQK